jgi:hypothetical protein
MTILLQREIFPVLFSYLENLGKGGENRTGILCLSVAP